MKDGGRLSAAIEVLAAFAREHRPLTEILKDWGNAHRFAGSGDRGAIGNLVHDALRRRASLAWRMGADTPRALVLGVYAIVWENGLEKLDAALAADRHAPEPLTDAERSALLATDPVDAPDAVLGDTPEWLDGALRRAFGEEAAAEGAALARRAPLDLRVNTLKAERAKVAKALSRFSAAAAPYSPVGLRIAAAEGAARSPHVESEPGYRRGHFEIQDEGSQLAALIAGAAPGDQVLDFCAGAGGKTLALAAAMANKGQVHAHDAERRRLAPIFARLKRAGVRNTQIVSPDDETALRALAGRMDVVLVDAPCTGSGVWRRRPDAKWRLTEKALDQRRAEQAALLDKAAGYVRPGGRMVYVTCSILPQENEDQVAGFLDRLPGFALADPDTAWRASIGSALPAPFRVEIGSAGHAVRLTPKSAGTDGFFVAVLERMGV